MAIPQEIKFTKDLLDDINTNIRDRIVGSDIISQISKFLSVDRAEVEAWFTGDEIEMQPTKKEKDEFNEKEQERYNKWTEEKRKFDEAERKRRDKEEIEFDVREQQRREEYNSDYNLFMEEEDKRREREERNFRFMIQGDLSKLNARQMREAAARYTGISYPNRKEARRALDLIDDGGDITEEQNIQILQDYIPNDKYSWEFEPRYFPDFESEEFEFDERFFPDFEPGELEPKIAVPVILPYDMYLGIHYDNWVYFFNDEEMLAWRALLARLFVKTDFPAEYISGVWQSPLRPDHYELTTGNLIYKGGSPFGYTVGISKEIVGAKNFKSLMQEMRHFLERSIYYHDEQESMKFVTTREDVGGVDNFLPYIYKYWFFVEANETFIASSPLEAIIHFYTQASPKKKKNKKPRKLKNQRSESSNRKNWKFTGGK